MRFLNKKKIDLESEGDLFHDLTDFLSSLPRLTARALGYIGQQAALDLYQYHLRGQNLNLRTDKFSPSGVPLSGGAVARKRGEMKKGKTVKEMRMVSYKISANFEGLPDIVRIRSFPVNVYEQGRGRKGDDKRAGILRSKLPNTLNGRLANYIRGADRLIAQGLNT